MPNLCSLSLFRTFWRCCSIAIALFVLHGTAAAVPSFGRQTGMQCAGCHTVFPELNSFGRQFKLRAYTLSSLPADAKLLDKLPVSAILQASRTMTANVAGVDREMLPRDRDTMPQTAGLYYAGKITERTGAFVQYSYDGIERKWGVEMADLRFADSATLVGNDVLYGVTLNNGPTVSDIFNSTPMWGFPHVDSAGLMPVANPLLDMQLNSQVGGVTTYAWINDFIYAEAGIYRTAKTGALRPLGWGIEKARVLDGYAPYWRLALQHDLGSV